MSIENAISVKKTAPNLVYYRDSANEWRWHLVAANGRIVATSGEGYERIDGAINGFHAAAAAAAAPVVEVVRTA